MKVLVISRNAWDDTNSIGNTLSNFFDGMDDVQFANIYFRSSRPNNNICKLYYHVTEKEIIKNWFSPHKLGRKFEWDKTKNKPQTVSIETKEKKLIRFIQKYNFKTAYKLSDYLWYSKKWINNSLNKFIEEFSPDIVVSFVKSAPQYYLTIKYLRENFNTPLFSWVADDEYTALRKNSDHKKIESLKYILNESAVVRGCSQQICDYYNSVFKCNAAPLYKGCDLSTPVKETANSPIKIVYAGNLLYGRMEIILKITQFLERHFKDKETVVFEIYSNTLLSKEEQNYFSSKKCTRYLGKQEYTTIINRLADADIVLHVESFEKEQILKTKYSFSTKIIDCLQSGSVMLAVGPKEVSSIDYIKKISGACVIDNIDDLDSTMIKLLTDTESLVQRAKKIREFACLHHNIENNSKEIREVLRKAKGV